MSNPLLQPDDRFRRPSLVDGDGRNRFAENEQDTVESDGVDPLAPPTNVVSPAYRPTYEAHYPHRGRFIGWLGTIGFLLPFALLLLFSGNASIGFTGFAASVVGIFISLVASILGYRELSGMSLGAIDPAGRNAALYGFRLGLAGLILGIGANLLLFGMVVRAAMEM
jgi:hypothetical protein